MYQETSGLAYDSIKKLGLKQLAVLKVIEYSNGQGMTNLEIADKLKIPINSVTPRTLELRKMGLVTDDGFRITRTGRKAIVWRVYGQA